MYASSFFHKLTPFVYSFLRATISNIIVLHLVFEFCQNTLLYLLVMFADYQETRKLAKVVKLKFSLLHGKDALLDDQWSTGASESPWVKVVNEMQIKYLLSWEMHAYSKLF